MYMPIAHGFFLQILFKEKVQTVQLPQTRVIYPYIFAYLLIMFVWEI